MRSHHEKYTSTTLTKCPLFILAVGDTDGLIKTKRYFTCPPKHGKLVRISNVIAVLPNKVKSTAI